MKKCSTVSFEGQVIFVGIDVHKESWVVICGIATVNWTSSA